MSPTTPAAPYVERILDGLDDGGGAERVVYSIAWREGGIWSVSRATGPVGAGDGRPEEIFSGYELDDALQYANEALEDDVRVLEVDGKDVRVTPFTRREILPLLEHWFLHSS